MLHHEPEIHDPQAAVDPGNNLIIGITDSQYTLTAAALGIEYSSKKTGHPGVSGRYRPRDEVAHLLDRGSRMGANRMHRLALPDRFLEDKLGRKDSAARQIIPRALQCLHIAQRQPELVLVTMRPARSLVVIRREQSVTAYQPTQITMPIVLILIARFGEGARAHEFVIDREVRPLLVSASHSAGHELPTTLGQKAMILSRYQTRAV
jgi:hypothetical protein